MKKLLFTLACLACMGLHAEVADALKGIWPVTDKAMTKSLNGEWRLKVIDGIADHPETVPEADTSWGTIPVPGCWEPYGFSKPKYNYPDSLTGYYRTTFTVPSEWQGQRVVLRLDGVLRGYDLWLNGQLVGTWESAYNTCHFDLTPYLTRRAFRGEEQQLAMRVYSQFKGYEFDCFDDWATMGIFRDVTLCAVPATHLSDLTVTTRIDGEIQVEAEVANATRHTVVEAEIAGVGCSASRIAETQWSKSLARQIPTAEAPARPTPMAQPNYSLFTINYTLPHPRLWTAETPYLYTLFIYIKEKGRTLQTFTHRIGIREVSVEGNRLLVNGQPVKLRGVNAHSTDPRTVKVIGDTLTLKDMHMMKEASVNYMRLSHYPREPRFYELADSLGFYLVDEVPFGFGDKHLSKRSYQDILKTRARATVQRDKLHPSVIIWSVGNENPLPKTCVEVGEYVDSLDSSRPYCFPQVGSYFRKFWEKAGVEPATVTAQVAARSANGGADTADTTHPFPSKAPVYAPHYPTTGQIGGFYQHLDRPVVFTEYCHTLGISFEDHDRQWDIIERTPGIAGGSVWEWGDQGMPFKVVGHASERADESSFSRWRTDGSERYQKVYTSETGGFEMSGNFGTDGLLYADRTPLPNYYELQHNYARAFVSSVGCANSAATADDPAAPLPLVITNRYDFLNLKDNVTFHWRLTADRDTVARGSFSPDCAARSSVAYALSLPSQLPSASSVGYAGTECQPLLILHFVIEDAQGHTFLRQSFPLAKPDLTMGTGTEFDKQDSCSTTFPQASPLGMPSTLQPTFVRTGRKPTMCERITQKGRLPQRYLLPLDNDEVKADIRYTPITDAPHDATTLMGGTEITFTLTPDTADVFRAELGLAYLLDKKIDRVQWLGQGPFPSYPGRRQACRYGLWAKHKDDLYFEGNHGGIDAALLTDADGNGLLITGDSLDLNFEQTDRGIVLTVNAAVSGQGPKFAKTAFNAWKPGDNPVKATFRAYEIKGSQWPHVLSRLFDSPRHVPAPFKPFLTQYDTYLLRLDDICK